ncbi:MAG: nitric oxide reductase large subunit, partial [Candidatus Krumholzibacteriota bacterium]|nr:nitric oxide reductase large subunit [Candidatus Krumholzibacteriota bacterium]
MSITRLRWAAIICFVVAMGGLLIGGLFANRNAPPYPASVKTTDGQELFTRDDIIAGQNVYQRYGLMDHGSVWGHGSQRGMEFSAVSLHLTGEAVRKQLAMEVYGASYDGLDEEQRSIIDLRTQRHLKVNRYDASNEALTLSPQQQAALVEILDFWERTFRDGDSRYGFL